MFFSGGLPRYTEPLYRPPSEGESLIFQITEGCSYNNCSFCGMYIHKPFRLKPLEDIFAEINRISETYAKTVVKVFLADGDAAIYPTDDLIKILDKLNEKFPRLRRISAYAGPHALMKKSSEDWTELAKRRMKLLYFGLESGNNKVLELMNKGMKSEKILPGFLRAKEAGIDFSVMVILGGGGKKLSVEHMQDTTAWLNIAQPKFVSLLTLFLRRKRNYFDSVEKPSMGGLLDEAYRFVNGINEGNMIFRSNHVSNLIRLEGILPRDKNKILEQIKLGEKYYKENGSLDEVPDFYEEF